MPSFFLLDENTHLWIQKCYNRPTLRSAAVTSLPSSSPAGRKAFTWEVLLIAIAKWYQTMLDKSTPNLVKKSLLGENWLKSLSSQRSGQVDRWSTWPSTNGLATRRHLLICFTFQCFALQSICRRPDPDTNLNVGKNGLEVTELNRGCRLASPSRSWGRHWYSWSCSRPEADIFCLLRTPRVFRYFFHKRKVPKISTQYMKFRMQKGAEFPLPMYTNFHYEWSLVWEADEDCHYPDPSVPVRALPPAPAALKKYI